MGERLSLNGKFWLPVALIQCLMLVYGLFCGGSVVRAEGFSSSNLQLLYGASFKDPYYGNHTRSGDMATLTFEHFNTWSHGDQFLFVDLTSGRFNDFGGTPNGERIHAYGEWAPRLSLSALTGRAWSGPGLRDVFLAGQLNADDRGFSAQLFGMGFDFEIAEFDIASLNVYARKDSFNRTTWQATWGWAFSVVENVYCEGYLDLNGTDTLGTEINTQPRLLLDIGHWMTGQPKKIMLGTEWYYHRHKQLVSSVPQLMVKWLW